MANKTNKATKAAAAKTAADKEAADKSARADELQKLASSPSPAVERTDLGDWAKANNPGPEEQRAESLRTDAIRELESQSIEVEDGSDEA